MLDSLVFAAVMLVPNDDTDRQFSASRPNRGVHRSLVIEAATFPADMRGCASRILARESGGTLNDPTSGMGARNPSSSASGRWQFLDTSWRRPLSFHVRDRLVEFGMPVKDARDVRSYLEATHISQWPGVIQDVGFIETVERSGYSPWGGCP